MYFTKKSVLCIILTLTVVPLLVLFLFLPILCIRLIVLVLSKFFRPDLFSFVAPRSAILCTDYNKLETNPNFTLLITILVEGIVDEFEVISALEKLLQIKQNGNFKYRTLLTSYIERWMGFYFWKTDNNFKIKSHIKVINGENLNLVNPESRKAFEVSLLQCGYSQGRSPWELNIVQNWSPGHSAIIAKFHHSLADGYSVLNMFAVDLCGKPEAVMSTPVSKISVFYDIYLTLFQTPYDIISSVVFGAKEVNAWHGPHLSEKLKRNLNLIVIESKKIPLSILKDIRQKYELGFLGVIFSGYTAAIRKIMEKRGEIVPQFISMGFPFPYPGHPDEMCNHWSAGALTLPTGINDPLERIHFLRNSVNELRDSTGPTSIFKMQPLIGSLFSWMMTPFSKLDTTVSCSDFPGPLVELKFQGHKIVDVYFQTLFAPGNVGLIFYSTSYNNVWKFNVVADSGLFKKAEVEFIIESVLEEFEILHGTI